MPYWYTAFIFLRCVLGFLLLLVCWWDLETLKKEGVLSLSWPKRSQISVLSHLSADTTYQLSWYKNGATPLLLQLFWCVLWLQCAVSKLKECSLTWHLSEILAKILVFIPPTCTFMHHKSSVTYENMWYVVQNSFSSILWKSKCFAHEYLEIEIKICYLHLYFGCGFIINLFEQSLSWLGFHLEQNYWTRWKMFYVSYSSFWELKQIYALQKTLMVSAFQHVQSVHTDNTIFKCT